MSAIPISQTNRAPFALSQPCFQLRELNFYLGEFPSHFGRGIRGPLSVGREKAVRLHPSLLPFSQLPHLHGGMRRTTEQWGISRPRELPPGEAALSGCMINCGARTSSHKNRIASSCADFHLWSTPDRAGIAVNKRGDSLACMLHMDGLHTFAALSILP